MFCLKLHTSFEPIFKPFNLSKIFTRNFLGLGTDYFIMTENNIGLLLWLFLLLVGNFSFVLFFYKQIRVESMHCTPAYIYLFYWMYLEVLMVIGSFSMEEQSIGVLTFNMKNSGKWWYENNGGLFFEEFEKMENKRLKHSTSHFSKRCYHDKILFALVFYLVLPYLFFNKYWSQGQTWLYKVVQRALAPCSRTDYRARTVLVWILLCPISYSFLFWDVVVIIHNNL